MAYVAWKKNGLASADAKVKKAAADGLDDAAQHILTEATKTVPHDKGTLSDSGSVDVDREGLRATVYYGGLASAYCVRQHEETGWHHPAGRRAKWLEATFKEEYYRVKHYMASKLKASM